MLSIVLLETVSKQRATEVSICVFFLSIPQTRSSKISLENILKN